MMSGRVVTSATQHSCGASIARATNQMLGWSPSPDRDGCLAKRVVARELLAGDAALDSLLHSGAEIAGFDQIAEHLGDVTEVEEVTLPFDELVAVEPEPAA